MVTDGEVVVNLHGDGWGGRCQPCHTPTQENEAPSTHFDRTFDQSEKYCF